MDREISLYQQITTLIQPLGQVEALLLTSFGLDVSYLEKSILPAFFPHLGEGPATEPHRPLFEYLEETPTPISVLFDANNLVRGETKLRSSGSVTKELRWQAHPVVRASGCFHPKVIVALVRNAAQLSLVIGCSSANLTRPGWGKNYEACALEVIPLYEGVKNSLLLDVQALLDKLKEDAPGSEAIRQLQNSIASMRPTGFTNRGYQTNYRSRLWFGQDGHCLSEWLRREVLRGDLSASESGWKLEILSPYFSVVPPKVIERASQQFTKRGDAEPDSILCLCPHDGNVFDIDPEVVAAFNEVEHFSWAEFPNDKLRSQLRDKDGNKLRRFLHAKVYRFWTPRNEVLVVGSANASTQGNRDQLPGNDEACLIFSRTVKDGAQPLSPWLRPINRPVQASECRSTPLPNEDQGALDPVPKLSVRFDWVSHVLELNNQDARRVDIYLGGSHLPLASISSDHSKKLRLSAEKTQSIFRSPTVKVALPHSKDHAWLCLVEEANLHAKPPAPTMERSVDDLIRDWQMGASERQADHIARAALPDDLRASSEGSTPELDIVVDQDRLNDIFLAMWRFKSETLSKIEGKGDLDDFTRLQIQSRLFGRGAMSVRYLASKLDPNGDVASGALGRLDPVEHYIALLSLSDAVLVLSKPLNRLGFRADLKTLIKDLEMQIAKARADLLPLLNSDPRCPGPVELLNWVEEHYGQKKTRKAAS